MFFSCSSSDVDLPKTPILNRGEENNSPLKISETPVVKRPRLLKKMCISSETIEESDDDSFYVKAVNILNNSSPDLLGCSEEDFSSMVSPSLPFTVETFEEEIKKGKNKILFAFFKGLEKLQRLDKMVLECEELIHTKDITTINGQPKLLNMEFKLKDYQILGLNWLYSLYQKGLNGILADEMVIELLFLL
jgi:SNF2 family DNA or RNA helicase